MARDSGRLLRCRLHLLRRAGLSVRTATGRHTVGLSDRTASREHLSALLLLARFQPEFIIILPDFTAQYILIHKQNPRALLRIDATLDFVGNQRDGLHHSRDDLGALGRIARSPVHENRGHETYEIGLMFADICLNLTRRMALGKRVRVFTFG